MIKVSFQKIGLFLLYLYIFFSYTAQDIIFPSKLNTIFLYCFLIWGVLEVFITKRLEISAYSKWYLLFFLYSMFLVLYSPKIEFFANEEMYLILVTFILTYTISLVIKNFEDFKGVCWCFSISSFVFVGVLYFTGNLVATQSNRLGGDIVGNANTFSSMLMVAVMCTIWLLIYNTKGNFILKIILSLILVCNEYAMLLSGGRKFIIIPIIFLYILLLLKKDSFGRTKVLKYTIIICVIIFILYNLMMNIPEFYDIIGYRMQGLINSFTGNGKVDGSAQIRHVMKVLAIERWKYSPLWGFGFDSFKFYNQSVTGHFYYSHCNYTELLYNGGIIYFLMYYFLFIICFKKIWKYRKKMNTKYLAFSFATLLCVIIFEYGAVTYNLTNIHIMLCLAAKLLEIRKEENNVVKESKYIFKIVNQR